jgi:hypothetical protein
MQRRLGAIVAAIGMVLTIIVNLLKLEELLGWPITYWNVVFMVLVLVGFLAVYFSIEEIKKEITEKVYQQMRKDIEVLKASEPLKGSLDSVSLADKYFIISLSIGMSINHVHGGDLQGLLADRASGVPLNELMTRECSICGIPRNKKSDKWGM